MIEFSKLAKLAAISAAVAAAPIAASAATVTISVLASSGDGSGAAANTSDVYAGMYGAYVPVGATFDANVVSPAPGSVAGSYRSPFDSNTLEDVNSYFAVGPDQNAPNPATLAYGDAQTSLTMLWGSVDSYNYLTFMGLGSGGSVQVSGTEVASAIGSACGAPVNFACTALLTFSVKDDNGADTTFSSLEFYSDGQQAFEFALSAVPVPAAGFLLVGGLGALAAFKRRKSA